MSKSSTGSSDGLLLPAVVAVAAAAVMQATATGSLDSLLSAPHAATKPYGTFEAFFPHYMHEHSQPGTRVLHYVGSVLVVVLLLAAHPGLVLCVLAALAAAVAAFPFARHVPHGLFEMALMLGLYLVMGARLTGSWRRAALPMVVAYAFAWVGHAFIEHNRPATFIYPSFSLMGDFKMLWEALSSGRV